MKILYSFFFLLPAFCFSQQEWINNWHKGSEQLRNGNYEEARSYFVKAIEEIKKTDNETPSYLYVDLAQTSNELKLYDQAVEESTIVINDPNAQKIDRVKALWIRASAKSQRGDNMGMLQDYELVKNLDQKIPISEIHDGTLILRNLPPLDASQEKFFAKFAVEQGLCESENDVSFHDGVLIIKMSK